MQNYKKSARSRGIVVFATNTETTDYIGIAERSLKLANHFLNLPCTLITDASQESWINNRYDVDQCKFVEWKNIGRHTAYQHSPYDETIVIDADYIIQDNSLNAIFELEWDYLLQRKSHAVTHELHNVMGPYSLPFVWATVFAFRRTDKAQLFFNLVDRVQKNYAYYRDLFNLQQRNYRNDYAFAIADIIINGFDFCTHRIPGSMLTVDKRISRINVKDNSYIIRDTEKAYVIPRTNLHILSKQYLQSEEFDQFIKDVTA